MTHNIDEKDDHTLEYKVNKAGLVCACVTAHNRWLVSFQYTCITLAHMYNNIMYMDIHTHAHTDT